jgi:nitrite reductase/ring-hydroxylating ferredoxin subunit
MSDDRSGPRWRQDFPIKWEEDHYVTRRELARFLTLGSGLLVCANAGVALAGRGLRAHGPMPRVLLRGARELAPRSSLLFRYPSDEDPCIALRQPEGSLAAFSQVCTHLSCAVVYEPAKNDLFCPCHEGTFECAGGRPIAGPPTRRLPRILLEEASEGVFAIGVEI